MLNMILHWLLTAAVLLLVAYILPGFNIAGFSTALVVALVLGLINITIKPLATLLTLPINLVTLGLFSLVINAAMLALAAWLVPGFEIQNFFAAFIGALLLGLITALLGGLDNQLTPTSRY